MTAAADSLGPQLSQQVQPECLAKKKRVRCDDSDGDGGCLHIVCGSACSDDDCDAEFGSECSDGSAFSDNGSSSAGTGDDGSDFEATSSGSKCQQELRPKRKQLDADGRTQARLPKKAAMDSLAIRGCTGTLGLPVSQQREADAGHVGPARRKQRMCKRIGCGKQAVRGGDPDYCIAHGGGRRCQQSGCKNVAQGGTRFCKRHGGGRRCQQEGCGTAAQGNANYCFAHGGGRRCQQ
jgi:hypothetical protein